MTDIKSAVKELKEIPHHIGEDCDGYELRALHLAINSLKAWEEVLQELEKYHSYAFKFNDEYYDGKSSGLKMAIDIINQKLAEIEEVR